MLLSLVILMLKKKLLQHQFNLFINFMAKRAHDYAFTILRYDEKPYHALFEALTKVADYVTFGLEVAPVTGMKHIQGYIWFKDRITYPAAKKHLGPCYCARALKSPLDNVLYCGKQNENFPYDGYVMSQGDFNSVQSKYEALTKPKVYVKPS